MVIAMFSKVFSRTAVSRTAVLSKTQTRLWLARSAYLSQPQHHHFHQSLTPLFAKSKKEGGNSDEDKWVTINLSSEKEMADRDMQRRINEAKTFTQFQLNDNDADEFDRMLGVDEDLITKGKSTNSRKKTAVKKNNLNFDSRNSKKKVRMELEKAVDNSDMPNKLVRGFLEINPFICSGCGSAFQSKNENNPGFLPAEKFQEHRRNAELIKNKQEAIKVLEMADVDLDSPSAESLLRAAGMTEEVIAGIKSIGVRSRMMEENDGAEDVAHQLAQEESVCICQRCFRLQQYGQVEQSLRPGWSENQLLTPERFETLLGSIKNMETVVLSIVDIFDIQGSVVPNLKQIAGTNPVLIAVNKIDLLPKDISKVRVASWVYSELKRICGFVNPSDDRYYGKQGGVLKMSNIHLISCQSDFGIEGLMRDLIPLAGAFGNKVHVMGAANVGKSSFINRILNPTKPNRKNESKKKQKTPMVTVSNLPGTTLDFLRIKLPNGITMIDTPGLINVGHLTSKLTTTELKQVIPNKPINPVTLRMEEGKCVLIGGLAKFEMVEVRM